MFFFINNYNNMSTQEEWEPWQIILVIGLGILSCSMISIYAYVNLIKPRMNLNKVQPTKFRTIYKRDVNSLAPMRVLSVVP